jgi:hypothetical protein
MQRADTTIPYHFWILVSGGVLTALVLGSCVGFLGYVVGFPLGAAAMLVILSSASLAWTCAQGILFRGVPLFPVCRNGCCRGGGLADPGDYTMVWDTDCTVREFRCRCGDAYRKVGRRFVEVAADGTCKPYLIWSRFRGWCPDRAQEGEQDADPPAR